MNAEEKLKVLIQNPDFVTLRSNLEEQEKFTPSGKQVLRLIANLIPSNSIQAMIVGDNEVLKRRLDEAVAESEAKKPRKN